MKRNTHAELLLHFNYCGSAPQAFGGVEKWPVLTLEIAFPEGRTDLRTKAARELMKWVEDNVPLEIT